MKTNPEKSDFDIIKDKSDFTGIVLYMASNSWQRTIREKLSPLGITLVQLLLLNAIAALQNSKIRSNQVNISRQAGCDKMMASKVLRELAKLKLIRRQKLKSDARAIGLQLTAAGQEMLKAANPIFFQAEEHFFAEMKKENKCRERLVKLIKNHED
jgi:DNA-binding MarR family transcriptional regulator